MRSGNPRPTGRRERTRRTLRRESVRPPGELLSPCSRADRGLPEAVDPFDGGILVAACGARVHASRDDQRPDRARRSEAGNKGSNHGIRPASFMDPDPGSVDDETCRLDPVQKPFGARLSPMSKVQDVTHVSGLYPKAGGGGGEPEIQRSLVRPPGYSAAALATSYPLAGCEFGISNISDQETGL